MKLPGSSPVHRVRILGNSICVLRPEKVGLRGFRTGVQLPSPPPNSANPNSEMSSDFAYVAFPKNFRLSKLQWVYFLLWGYKMCIDISSGLYVVMVKLITTLCLMIGERSVAFEIISKIKLRER